MRHLRTWVQKYPELSEAFGTWCAECLAPHGLIAAGSQTTFIIDEIEPMMATRLLNDIRRQVAEGEATGMAKGEAKGKAEGAIATRRSLVASGALTVDAARAQVEALRRLGTISAGIARDALKRLG